MLSVMSAPLTVLGLLERGPSHGYDLNRDPGPERRRYVITEAGIAEVERWLAEPVPPEPDLTSELFAKVVLALMLGRQAGGYLDAQRAAHLQRMRELTGLKRDSDQVGVLIADHALYRLEADLRWTDHTAARLDMLARAVR
jgi:DNA-binding PadR family transcriptional regulator